jgi:NAD(P)-dependent dehydrogenase (short-subunit alcohol dehydrogenase family)
MRFKDKGVLITGAGSGIGRETALECAAEGGIVAAADIDIRMAERTVEEIAKRGGRGYAFGLDVTDPAAVTAASAALTFWSTARASARSSRSSTFPWRSGTG